MQVIVTMDPAVFRIAPAFPSEYLAVALAVNLTTETREISKCELSVARLGKAGDQQQETTAAKENIRVFSTDAGIHRQLAFSSLHPLTLGRLLVRASSHIDHRVNMELIDFRLRQGLLEFVDNRRSRWQRPQFRCVPRHHPLKRRIFC